MLHPEARRLLDKMKQRDIAPYDVLGVAASRRQLDEGPDPGHYADVGEIEDRLVVSAGGDIPIRIYQPEARGCPATVLYLHGGGWVLGSIRSHDNMCRRLCAAAGCTVVAVDYRLAPEHPFPAGLEDCHAVLSWIGANIDRLGGDPGALVVAGDSAGGNLAAALALKTRESGPGIALQVLIYPSLEVGAATASMRTNAEGYGLTSAMMDWFASHYCPPERRSDPLASPLLAPDHAGLPPALIIVAGYDPLHDEGVAYAMRLIEAGVPATLSSYGGQIHGFAAMTRFLSDGRRAQAEIVDAIRRMTQVDGRWSGGSFLTGNI